MFNNLPIAFENATETTQPVKEWTYFNFPKLAESFSKNAVFFAEFVGIMVGIIGLALIAELIIRKKRDTKEKILSTRKVAGIGILAAIAGVLMLLEIPLVFAPSFYKLDFSELPVLICGFAYGPVAGVLCEAVKILVKMLLKGTSTAFVGELANFVVGCFLILPATIIYHAKRTKTFAVIGCVVGTICIVIVGPVFNALYLLPKFAEMFYMEVEDLVAMGTKINPAVTNIFSFVALCVAPLNLIKGVAVSVVTILIYHPLRRVLKGNV